MVNQVTLSLIIFDNDFFIFDEIFQDLGYFAFTASTSSSISYTVKTTPYTALRFVTNMNVTSRNSVNSANIVLNTGSSTSPTTYSINPNLGGSFLNYTYCRLRTLMVYPTLAKDYGYTVQATDYFFVTSPFKFSYSIPNYN